MINLKIKLKHKLPAFLILRHWVCLCSSALLQPRNLHALRMHCAGGTSMATNFNTSFAN